MMLGHYVRPPMFSPMAEYSHSGYHFLTRHEIRLGRFILFGWFTAPRSYWRKFR